MELATRMNDAVCGKVSKANIFSRQVEICRSSFFSSLSFVLYLKTTRGGRVPKVSELVCPVSLTATAIRAFELIQAMRIFQQPTTNF